MAKFTPVRGLDEIVARMVADAQRKHFAEPVADAAKRFAPPTKTWVHVGDGRVRRAHRQAGGQEVPENLRFDLTSFEWDLKHPATGSLTRGRPGGDGWKGTEARLVPGHSTWMLYPRDQTPRAYVQAVNCFPGETLVSPIGNLKAAIRAPYQGVMVTVRMRSGGILTGTPNHPVLTDRGWVGLGGVNVGDHLVRAFSGQVNAATGVGHAGAHPDVEDAPARIDEVFEAASLLFSAHRVSPRSVNFYGDRPAGEVDVVPVDSSLRDRCETPVTQHRLEFDLAQLAEAVRRRRPGRRTLPSTTLFIARVASRFVRSGGPGSALLRRGAALTDHQRLGAPAKRLPRLLHHPVDDSTGDPEGTRQRQSRLSAPVAAHHLVAGNGAAQSSSGGLRLGPHRGSLSPEETIESAGRAAGDGCEFLDGLAGDVAALDVVEEVVVDPDWSGHVYTLSTSSDIYAAGGYIVRNCRCQITINPDGIAKLIRVEPTLVVGTKVTTTVAAVGKWVVEAEQGTVYPSAAGDMVAIGTHFMGRAAAAVAARSRTRR